MQFILSLFGNLLHNGRLVPIEQSSECLINWNLVFLCRIAFEPVSGLLQYFLILLVYLVGGMLFIGIQLCRILKSRLLSIDLSRKVVDAAFRVNLLELILVPATLETFI